MKKKVFLVMMVLMIALALVANGCGGGDSADSGSNSNDNGSKTDNGKQVAEKHDLVRHVHASGPTGSGWYPMSVLFSDIWMDNVDWLDVTVIEGGAVGNVRTVNKGENAQSGLTFASNFIDGLKGVGAFEGEKQEKIMAIGALYPTWWNFVTLNSNADINSVEEAIEAKVHVNPGKPGYSSEQTFLRVLAELGYDSYEAYEAAGGKVSLGSYTDAANTLRDGIIQMAVAGGSPNVTAFTEVDATKPIKVLPLSQDTIDKIDEKQYGYAVDWKVPANTYKNQTDEVPALVTMGVLVVNKDVADDVAYELTKNLWENVKRIQEEQPVRGKWFDPETGYTGIPDPETNIHPGALKYYKEIGVAK